AVGRLRLDVVAGGTAGADRCCGPLLQAAQAALAEADRRQHLPDTYTDVTEGFLAEWKRRGKPKLLNNIQRAPADVRARRQQHVLAGLQELAECCAVLDQAGGGRAAAGEAVEGLTALVRRLQAELAASRRRLGRVEKELRRLKRQADRKSG